MEGINVNTCSPMVNNCATKKAIENQVNNPAQVDLTEKYSQDEIVNILKAVGTYQKPIYPCRYSVEMYENGSLVINNTNMTNDSTEITQKGAVRHCGSWHNKEIAPEGSFINIIEDANARITNN